MDDMLQLPPREALSTASSDSVARDPAEAAGQIRDLWARISALDEGADAVLAEALDLANAGHDAVHRFGGRVQARLMDASAGELPFAAAVYDCAGEALAADQIGEASVGLVILLDVGQLRPLAMIGLAACAARLGRIQYALALALGSRAVDPSHPRALLIAGYSESRQGHMDRARRYFAVASRLARHGSGHAAEFRMAQRLLLTLPGGLIA